MVVPNKLVAPELVVPEEEEVEVVVEVVEEVEEVVAAAVPTEFAPHVEVLVVAAGSGTEVAELASVFVPQEVGRIAFVAR